MARRQSNGPDFYELLGVGKNAEVAEIENAYKKLALIHHSEKGGDTEKFKEITRAYEVLSESVKRTHYNKYNETGFKNAAISARAVRNSLSGFARIQPASTTVSLAPTTTQWPPEKYSSRAAATVSAEHTLAKNAVRM